VENNLKFVNLLIMIAMFLTFPIVRGFAEFEVGINAIDPTTIKVDNNKFKISGGTQAGINLYHQFDTFNLSQGQIAEFMANDSVENIINRISGGDISHLDGKIQCTQPSNLFFINPAGFVWGEHASIDINGSLYVSTANYIEAKDKTKYGHFLQEIQFSTSSPESFGFLDKNGSVIFEGSNIIPGNDNDKNSVVTSIYLNSNDIKLTSTKIEPQKQISLSGVPENNIAPIHLNDNSIQYYGNISINSTHLSAKNNIYLRSGNIELKNGSSLKINGNFDKTNSLSNDTTNNNNSIIPIVASGFVSFDNSTVELLWNDSSPKNLYISGQSVEFKNNSNIEMQSSIRSGNVTINAKEITLFSNSDIFTQTSGSGALKTGSITIDSQDVFFIQGSCIQSATYGIEKAGNIKIQASRLIIDGTDNTETSGFSSMSFIKGNAGDILIDTNYFQCTNGAKIIANTKGEGNAGTIQINADDIHLKSGISDENMDIMEVFSSGIYSMSEGQGKSGIIDIHANKLEIQDGAIISNSVSDSGNGASTTIDASDIIISGESIYKGEIYKSSILSESSSSGNSGEIFIHSNKISLSDNSIISVASSDEGNAGTIQLSGSFLSLASNACISTEAKYASGGNISIESDQSIYMFSSTISSSVKKGDKDGGNIDINTDIGLLNSSQILANAHEGAGGNITINAKHLIRSSNSLIDASSELGIHGNVNILSPEITFNSGLNVLPSTDIDASQWLTKPCEQQGDNLSSFIVHERDALPQSSDDLLIVPLYILLSKEAFIKDIKPIILNGQYQKSIAIIENSMTNTIIKKNDIAATIFLAHTYMALGYKKKSQTLLNRIEKLVDSSNSIEYQSLYYSIYGDLLLSTGKSLNQSKKALSKGVNLAMISKNPLLIAFSLTCQGNYYAVEGLSTHIYDFAWDDYDKAFSYLQDDHDIAKSVVLINMAHVSLKKNASIFESAQIETSIVKAFQAVQKLEDHWHKGFYLLMVYKFFSHYTKHFSEKIYNLSFLSKTCLEQLLKIAETIEQPQLLSDAYGYLGQYYLRNNIQQAISYIQKSIFIAQQHHLPEILYYWQWQLAKIYSKSNNIDLAIEHYENAIETVKPIQRQFFYAGRFQSDIFKESIQPIFRELIHLKFENMNHYSEKSADILQLVEHSKIAELQNFYKDECIEQKDKTIYSYIEQFSKMDDTLVIYPLLSDPPMIVILSNKGTKLCKTHITLAQINRIAMHFNTRLNQSIKESRIKHLGNKLYQALILPIQSYLTPDIKTLIFVPDGILRLIPFAAIFNDKEQEYLCQRHAIVILPALTLSPTHKSIQMNRVLLGGLSLKKNGYSELPDVTTELQSIHQIMGGDILKDKQFTVEHIKESLQNKQYDILHFCTHGTFSNHPESIQLNTYTSPLFLNDLKRVMGIYQYRKQPIELLTLSACNTARGDERAALGLGGFAVKTGVKSAIASLWKVNDNATSEFMISFYQLLKNSNESKSQCFRKAQLKMITNTKFSHPSYWAPFIFIGEWR